MIEALLVVLQNLIFLRMCCKLNAGKKVEMEDNLTVTDSVLSLNQSQRIFLTEDDGDLDLPREVQAFSGSLVDELSF